ncbi:hypothetical protein CEK25_004157 [Fusarium fujikuroi]|nr:hypothetical protein CEK25_004157 [Fusarium fujikuroi]
MLSEIAAIENDAKPSSSFKIITAIWSGDIVFWDSFLSLCTLQRRSGSIRTADPFSRLRVPKYSRKEVLFYFPRPVLRCARLRDPTYYNPWVILFLWIFLAFFYDELSEWLDAVPPILWIAALFDDELSDRHRVRLCNSA